MILPMTIVRKVFLLVNRGVGMIPVMVTMIAIIIRMRNQRRKIPPVMIDEMLVVVDVTTRRVIVRGVKIENVLDDGTILIPTMIRTLGSHECLRDTRRDYRITKISTRPKTRFKDKNIETHNSWWTNTGWVKRCTVTRMEG